MTPHPWIRSCFVPKAHVDPRAYTPRTVTVVTVLLMVGVSFAGCLEGPTSSVDPANGASGAVEGQGEDGASGPPDRGGATPVPGVQASDDDVLPWRIELLDCHQMHTSFAARAEDFESDVPEGFQIVADAASGTTSFGIEVDHCAEAILPATGSPQQEEPVVAEAPTGPWFQAWFTIPVEPPTELAAEGRHQIIIGSAFVAGTVLAQAYADGWTNIPVVTSDVLFHDHAQAATRGTMVEVRADAGRFTLESERAGGEGAFGAFTVHRWFVGEDGRLVRLTFANAESADLGFGPITFTSEGLGGAPPAHVGTSHEVHQLDAIVTGEVFP